MTPCARWLRSGCGVVVKANVRVLAYFDGSLKGKALVTRRKHLHVRDRTRRCSPKGHRSCVGRRICHSLFGSRLRRSARSVPRTPRAAPDFPIGGSPGRPDLHNPRSARRYDAGMSEYSLDGLVSQFAIVLTAMTESEALLLDRVRHVRFEAQNSQPLPVVRARLCPFLQQILPIGCVQNRLPHLPQLTPAPSEMAPAWEDDARKSRDGEPAPAWASSPRRRISLDHRRWVSLSSRRQNPARQRAVIAITTISPNSMRN